MSIHLAALLLRNVPPNCNNGKLSAGLLEVVSSVRPLCVAMGPSGQYAFCQLETIGDAVQMLTTLSSVRPLRIDSKEGLACEFNGRKERCPAPPNTGCDLLCMALM